MHVAIGSDPDVQRRSARAGVKATFRLRAKGSWIARTGVSVFGLTVACAGSRDSAEIGVSTKPLPDAGQAPGYSYVAKRTLGSVGLAELKGFVTAEGEALVESVANELDRCAAGFLREGHLATAAARIDAIVDEDGHLKSINVRVSPGDDATRNAILCFITPTKQFAFSPARSDAGVRRFALEGIWQPLGAH